VLCCDINDSSILFAGMATGDIAAINLPNNEVARVGGHDAPICNIFWIKEKGCLMTLGFDNLVRFWDISSNKNAHEM
jgi:WD40 repeat protein